MFELVALTQSAPIQALSALTPIDLHDAPLGSAKRGRVVGGHDGSAHSLGGWTLIHSELASAVPYNVCRVRGHRP